MLELLGTYITPTMQGSRNGVGMAIAWATMVTTGDDGYRKMAREVHSVHTAMKDAVNRTDGGKSPPRSFARPFRFQEIPL